MGRWFGMAMLAMLLANVPQLSAQRLTPEESKAFDRGDRESRAMITQFNCLNRMMTAVREKRLTASEKWVTSEQCVVIDRHYVYVMLASDTLYTRATRMSAYDLTTSAAYAVPLDTAGALSMARAEWLGMTKAGPRLEAAKRDAAPVTFRFDGDSIEVWLLPLQLMTGNPWSLGGEYGAIFSPDGRTLMREVDHVEEFRSNAVADTGLVRIVSRQARIPSLSEFLQANQLNALDRSVVIELPWGSATLPKGLGSPWVQLVGKKP